MPQNETTLFLHILFNFLIFTLTLAVLVLIFNFLPTFKYIKLNYLLDRDTKFSEINFLFLISNLLLRNTELTTTSIPVIKFINKIAFATTYIFKYKNFSKFYL